MEVKRMPMYRKSLMVLLLLLLAAAGGTLYGYYGEDRTVELAAAEKPSEAPEERIVVYVVGG